MPSSRLQSQPMPGGRAVVLTIVILCLLALTPVRFTGWINSFGNLAEMVFAPASHPVTILAHWVAPPRKDALSDDREEVVRQELERTRQAYLRLQLENDQLRRLVTDLQRGFSVQGSSTVRPLARPVVGNPSDLSGGMLVVRAGKSDGVTTNTVATYDGMQLVGRVEKVTAKFSEVKPITARHAGRLDAVVMIDDNGEVMLPCSLTPDGKGALVGPVTVPDTPDPNAKLEVGQDVRLRFTDGSWPESSQMLLIGRVVEIGPAPDAPIRRYITVEPLVDLRRISKVVLRIPVDTPSESGP
jgi:cell shape-determining protein MreC